MTRAFVIGAVLAILSACSADALDRERATQMLESADARFRTAIAEREAASSMATESFLDAARTYEAVAAMGFRNASLYADAGNAYLLGGDIGRAVLSYRRADELKPSSPVVKAGLADARERVQITIAQSTGSRLAQALTAWRRFIPAPVMIWSFAALYTCAWLVAIANAAKPRIAPRSLGIGFAIAAGLIGGLVVADHRIHDGARAGVVIAEGVTARNGPSATVYDPTFSTPLRPGVELVIIETRDGWHRVRLADGRETWLPTHAVETLERDRGREDVSAGRE